jgi:hypothetical protein
MMTEIDRQARERDILVMLRFLAYLAYLYTDYNKFNVWPRGWTLEYGIEVGIRRTVML